MFGDVLRGYRRRGGLTQEELASQAGVGLRTIRDLETGRIRQPRPSTARRLADALQLTGPDREGFLHASMFAAPDHGAQGTSPDRPVPVPAQLPRDVFGFTGRRAELLKLDELLATGCDRRELVIATVSGTAGVGKTALAIHWARQGADRFPDGQLYLDLRGFHRHGSPLPAAEAPRRLPGAPGLPAGPPPAHLGE